MEPSSSSIEVTLLDIEDNMRADAFDAYCRGDRFGLRDVDVVGDRSEASELFSRAVWGCMMDARGSVQATRAPSALATRDGGAPAGSNPGSILINPFQAFGDGRHPTTALCYRLLCRRLDSLAPERRCGLSLIDVGTGTGILAILAARMGVADIDALDISPAAVESARENCLRNNCDFIKVRRSDLAEAAGARRYDIVVANIVSPVIVANCAILAGLVKPDGIMIASGVSSMADEAVRRCFQSHGLRIIEHASTDGWNAYVVNHAPASLG